MLVLCRCVYRRPFGGPKRASIGMAPHRLSERRTTADPSTALGMTASNRGDAKAGFVLDDTAKETQKHAAFGMTLHRLSEQRATADPSTALGMTLLDRGDAKAGFAQNDTSG